MVSQILRLAHSVWLSCVPFLEKRPAPSIPRGAAIFSKRSQISFLATNAKMCTPVMLTSMNCPSPASRRIRAGAYRGAEFALLPEERRALRHFDQGIMRRLHGITRGGVRSGGTRD